MSLQIIKNGILDTIQDLGRYGYQHQGINPGGAMDILSAQLSNALLGKDLQSPVFELHFPASQILFEQETIICISGANFSPEINQQKIPLHQPFAVHKNTLLAFKKLVSGARCYMSVLHGIKLDKWMDSYSTNIKAEAGGWKGRTLQKGDILEYENNNADKSLTGDNDFLILPWGINSEISSQNEIRIMPANEWNWLADDEKISFLEGQYQITNSTDRMGYRLAGKAINPIENKELISSSVNFGTIQLLPDGQLIILMADHQTTGGYPRIANVISADLPLLAQKKPGNKIHFCNTDHAIAEKELIDQQKYLQQLQETSKSKISKYIYRS